MRCYDPQCGWAMRFWRPSRIAGDAGKRAVDTGIGARHLLYPEAGANFCPVLHRCQPHGLHRFLNVKPPAQIRAAVHVSKYMIEERVQPFP